MNIDAELARIERMKRQTTADYKRAMNKFDDDERELLGLRKLRRSEDWSVLGFADEPLAFAEHVGDK